MASKGVTRVKVATDRGVFMISVAAELAHMHPQTLRMYEARGLIEPKRSSGRCSSPWAWAPCAAGFTPSGVISSPLA